MIVDWAKTCEWCKGYPTTLNACACPPANPVPTAPDRPSNKALAQEWWAIKDQSDCWLMAGDDRVFTDDLAKRRLFVSEEAASFHRSMHVPFAAVVRAHVRVAELSVDLVNSPPHYSQGAVECIDAIESALGPVGFRAYCKGNALKYIWREEHKGGTESLRKAIWYLNRLVKP